MRQSKTPRRLCNYKTLLATGLLCAAVMLTKAMPLSAGVFCGDRITGGAASGATKEAATEAAKSWWASRAGALGRGYEHWGAGTDKKILCIEGEGGSFICTASAKPCLPDGAIPDSGNRIEL